MTSPPRGAVLALALSGLSCATLAAPPAPASTTHHVVYRVSSAFLGSSNIYFTAPNGRVRVNLAEADPGGDDWAQAVDLRGPVVASVSINTFDNVPVNGQSCEVEVDGQVVVSRIGPPPMPQLPGPAHTWSLTCKTPIDVPPDQLPPPRPQPPSDADEG